MGKGATQPKKGPYQRLIDREADAEAKRPAVNEFAASHGDYQHETIALTQGEIEGERGNVRVLRNRGGTTVERWDANGSLNRGQIEAIALYCRAWHRVNASPRITANWSLVSFIRGTPATDWISNHVEAKELLGLLDDKIFGCLPRHYFDVWQNVVLFDQSAGVAGGNGRSSAERAKTICLFIADMIATILRLG